MMVVRLSYRLSYASKPAQRDLWLRYAQAEAAYFSAQPDTATAIYEQLIADFPEPQRLEQRLYELAYAQGDFQRAWKYWQQWLDNSGADLGPLDQLQQAELQYQVGDYQGTKATLEQMTALPWRDFRIPYYTGLCHLQAGARRDAKRCFIETTRRLNPDIVGIRLTDLYRLHQVQPCPSAAKPTVHPSI